MNDDLPYDIVQNEKPPKNEQEVRARHESNRAGWNEGALRYTEGLDQVIEFLRAGKSSLHPVERVNLGDLGAWCETAIHLQCASGRDTLSLWVEGVRQVIGVDISDQHIENARRMSAALNAPARWYRCDVLDTPHELDGCADLVYTGRGALNWLQDLKEWGRVVYRLLKPGGVFHVLDDHPLTWLFDVQDGRFVYSGKNYFGHFDSGKGWPETYIGKLGVPVDQQARKYEALWSLAQVTGVLIQSGLVIEFLGEHPDAYWEQFPTLDPALRGRIPLTFSIKARRPI
jgi:SAM-dependent methyltransferase